MQNSQKKLTNTDGYFVLEEDQFEQITDYQQEIQENQKFRKFIDKMPLQSIAECYQEQQFGVSNLSASQYQSLYQNPYHKSTVLALPNISAHTQKDQSNNDSADIKKLYPFISFGVIRRINENLVNNYEYSQVKKQKSSSTDYKSLDHSSIIQPIDSQKQSFTFGRTKSYNSLLVSNDVSLSFSNSNVNNTHNSLNQNYSQKDLVQFELSHNQFQIEQIKQLNQQEKKQFFNSVINQLEQNPKYLQIPEVKQKPKAQPQISDLQQLLESSEDEKIVNTQATEVRMGDSQNNNKPQIFHGRQSESHLGRGQTYKAYWMEHPIYTWQPEPRMYFGIEKIDNFAYVFGGLGSRPLLGVSILDISKRKKKNIWSHIDSAQGELPPPRMAHSLNIYNKKIIIFGGEKKSEESEVQKREILNDVFLFDVSLKQWIYLRPNGDIVEGRKNHASVVLDQYLLVCGGLNIRGITFQLRDIILLNIVNSMWQNAQVKEQDDGFIDFGIFHHTLVPIFNRNRKKIKIYKNFDQKLSKQSSDQIVIEGLYLFGGINDKGEAMNTLYILKIDHHPFYWLKPETKGIPPRQRYSHTSTYVQNLSIMVVYGGKIETEDSDDILDDIYILFLQNLSWIQCKTYGKSKFIQIHLLTRPPRCGHCAIENDNSIIVFGGFNTTGYVSTELLTLNLDSKEVTQMHRNDCLEQEKQRLIQEFIKRKKQEDRQKELQEEKSRRDRIQFKMRKGSSIILDEDEKIQFEQRQKFQQLELKKKHLHLQIKTLSYQNQNSYLPLPQHGMQIEHRINDNGQFDQQSRKFLLNETQQFNEVDQQENRAILDRDLAQNKAGQEWQIKLKHNSNNPNLSLQIPTESDRGDLSSLKSPLSQGQKKNTPINIINLPSTQDEENETRPRKSTRGKEETSQKEETELKQRSTIGSQANDSSLNFNFKNE